MLFLKQVSIEENSRTAKKHSSIQAKQLFYFLKDCSNSVWQTKIRDYKLRFNQSTYQRPMQPRYCGAVMYLIYPLQTVIGIILWKRTAAYFLPGKPPASLILSLNIDYHFCQLVITVQKRKKTESWGFFWNDNCLQKLMISKKCQLTFSRQL